MSIKLIQLTDTDGELCLDPWGVDESDRDRFATVFLKVWTSIPLTDRRLIAEFWYEKCWLPMMALQANSQGGEHSMTGAVSFEMKIKWLPKIGLEPSLRGAMATTELAGTEIKFNWATCKLLPDNLLAIIVAHELGHVHHMANGKSRFTMTQEDLPTTADELTLLEKIPLRENAYVELYADQMVKLWGYDPLLPDAFLFQHFDLSKDGKHLKRKKPRNEKRAYNEVKHRILQSLIDVPKLREQHGESAKRAGRVRRDWNSLET